ncbi:MAG: hypothetical protein U1E89_08235 [Burkholderiaceae bacterium]
MLFGLIVTDQRHAGHAAGLLAAAAARGWDARCFLTDSGVLALSDEAFMAQASARPNTVAACKHSLDHLAPQFDAGSVKGTVVIGGQFQGAKLTQSADAVLVL